MTAPGLSRLDRHALDLQALCGALRARLAAPAVALRAPGADPAPRIEGLHMPPLLAAVAAGFGLSPFETELMALALAVEIDPATAEAVRARQPGRDPRPSFGLGFAVLSAPHWSAMSPDRPLLRWRLLSAGHAALAAEAPLTLAQRMLHALMGAGTADAELERWGRRLDPRTRLSDGQEAAAAALAEALETGPAQLVGACAADRDAILAAAANLCGRPAWSLGPSLPDDPGLREDLARLVERETVLTGMIPRLAGEEPAAALSRSLDAAHVLSGDEPRHRPGLPTRIIEAPGLCFADRRALWSAAHGVPATDLDRLAMEFPLSAQAIADIAAGGGGIAALRQGARSRTRGDTNGLATRRIPQAGWEDLALRPQQRAALGMIVVRVERQAQVLEHWGFGTRGRRGSGLAALFAGPSGTGKTLAAEVIAHALDLDLLHVDLSRIVSKWVGETEKNLDRVFALAERGGAVLLFDEADALFGKRSEVKDGRDRYANLEVSYLLQRMEAFAGLAILTTNQPTALDDAFTRRIGTVVHFPFPDASLRQQIWQRILPEAAPTEGVDAARLAQIAAAGGEIRNIALGAAYAAATGDVAARITMSGLVDAAGTELAKRSRSPGRGGRKEGGA